MTVTTFTKDQWPGAPRELPPLMAGDARKLAYALAADSAADVDELFIAYTDIGQRLAKAMHSPEASK